MFGALINALIEKSDMQIYSQKDTRSLFFLDRVLKNM